MYLAIDVGATKINISFFNKLSPKEIAKEIILPTTKIFLQDIKNIVDAAIHERYPVEAIGVSVPGFIVDEHKGVISAANIPDWEHKNLKGKLQKELKLKNVFILHDGKAHAMSEVIFTGIAGDFVFIAWGTGIGATYIRRIDNKVHAQQIEFGYQITQDQYIEALVGGGKFKERFSKKPENLSAKDWKLITSDFATGIANLMALNYPPLIIWGGGIAAKHTDKIDLIMEKAHKKFPFWNKPKYQMTAFGDRGGVIGALAEIKYQLSIKR